MSADVKVTFHAARQSPQQPAEVRVIQCDYKHDMAVLTYYGEPHEKNRWRSGSPLSVTWRNGSVSESFYGYVLYVVPAVQSDRSTLRVICIGTSYVFKDTEPAISIGLPIESTLRIIAARKGFNTLIAPTTEDQPMIARYAGETQWEYAVRLAKRKGYTLFVNKVRMHSYDPVPLLLANYDSLPVLNFIYGRGNVAGDLTEFEPVLGSEGPGELASRDTLLMGVDPATAKIVGASSSDTQALNRPVSRTSPTRFREHVAGQPVHGYADARSRVEGGTLEGRWTEKATAVSYGLPRTRQGSGVVVNGVSVDSDGLWYVHRAEHVLSTEEHPAQWRYMTHLDLRRDGRSRNGAKARVGRAVRPLTNARTQTNRRQPEPVLQGMWRSPSASHETASA